MSVETDPITDEDLEQATDWFYRLEAAPEDDGLRRAHADWLASGDSRRDAWNLIVKAWDMTGVATALTGSAPQHRLPPSGDAGQDGPRHRRADVRGNRRPLHGSGKRRLPLVGVAVVALAACVALLCFLPALLLHLHADHVTAAGVVRTVTLADGSVIDLGGESAVATTIRAGERSVDLLRGEAFFQIAVDRDNPFRVQAADLSITVTGTAFDVALTDDTVSVSVAEGSVAVALAGARQRHLGMGQMLRVDRRTGLSDRRAVAPADVGSWREGRLFVQDAAFDDVVDSIARHHDGAIIIAASSLRARRVTGAYDLNDPARALRGLTAPYGNVVRQILPSLIVVTDF